MAAEPAAGHERGDDPPRDARVPDELPLDGERDSRARAFAQGGVLDTSAPCAALACVLDEISGPARLATITTDDELIGLLGRWDAEESPGA